MDLRDVVLDWVKATNRRRVVSKLLEAGAGISTAEKLARGKYKSVPGIRLQEIIEDALSHERDFSPSQSKAI